MALNDVSLELNTGDSYTTFAQLDRDTLAMVLSAAYRDRLQPKTWWFPIVGRLPYKGFFHFDKALDEAQARGWNIVDMKKDWKVIYPD